MWLCHYISILDCWRILPRKQTPRLGAGFLIICWCPSIIMTSFKLDLKHSLFLKVQTLWPWPEGWWGTQLCLSRVCQWCQWWCGWGNGPCRAHVTINIVDYYDIAKKFYECLYRICGHRRFTEVQLDPRPFGFPFDRKVGFKLEDNNLKYCYLD